jgi:hypothetical protein
MIPERITYSKHCLLNDYLIGYIKHTFLDILKDFSSSPYEGL